MMNLKSFHFTTEGVRTSQTPVNVLAARDGFYEIRQNEIGVFAKKLDFVPDLPVCNEGFAMALPKIPFRILENVLSFFRHYSQLEEESEVMCQIFWDTEKKQYFVEVPEQRVSKASIHANLNTAIYTEVTDSLDPKFVQVVQIHSHNSMKAEFSRTDDECEKASMIYAVVGELNRFFPTIQTRVGFGGKFLHIDPSQVFEMPFVEETPNEWHEKVMIR